MLKNIKNNLGFTLIELLVTISIILLVTGASIAGFISFNDRQVIQTTAKDVQTMMRAGQVKARSGEGASECETLGSLSDGKLRGYQVTVSGNAVVLNRVCWDGLSTIEYEERSRVALGSNVSVSMTDDVVFLSLKGGTQIGTSNPQPNLSTITITGDLTGYEYEFEVHEGGEITNGDFN
jgi:prepilin-type N-terminal cleavage/methylation domain-containing protein